MGTEGADKHSGSTAANEQKDMEQKEHKLPNDFPRGRMHAMLLVGGRWIAGACLVAQTAQHVRSQHMCGAQANMLYQTCVYAGLRVLVVDDDPLCLKITEQMLKRCNYEGAGLHIACQASSIKLCCTWCTCPSQRAYCCCSWHSVLLLL
jgi:hypothetical protein